MSEDESALALITDVDIVDLERWGSFASTITEFFHMVQCALRSSNANFGFFTFEELADRYYEAQKDEKLKELKMSADSFLDGWIELSPMITGVIGGGSIETFFPFGVELEFGRDSTGLGDHIEHHGWATIQRMHDKYGLCDGLVFKFKYGTYPSRKRYRKIKKTPLAIFVNELEKQLVEISKQGRDRDEKESNEFYENLKTKDAKFEI